jgi:hypothetical protein
MKLVVELKSVVKLTDNQSVLIMQHDTARYLTEVTS